jgi:purine-nucleoside phosphorylase
MSIDVKIEYNNIPHFPVATVDGHPGKLIFGSIAYKPLKEAGGSILFSSIVFRK